MYLVEAFAAYDVSKTKTLFKADTPLGWFIMNEQLIRKLRSDPLPWLLESNVFTRYQTLVDLLEVPADNPEVKGVKLQLVKDPQVNQLLQTANDWFSAPAKRHNIPTFPHYTLRVLSDFGFRHQDVGIESLLPKIYDHLEDDRFAIQQELPSAKTDNRIASSNSDTWHALPCDSSLITYSLIRLGIASPLIRTNIDWLKQQWSSSQGWFCHLFFVENQFRREKIGCPMAAMMALEVFSQVEELRESVYVHNAFKPLKQHWQSGKSLYYFGRSKKFWTLKYPFVWYNALYMADVVTRFDCLKGEPLVHELVEWILSLQDENGRFKPTSIYMPYKSWEFANKKTTSPWITFLCLRIIRNFYRT